MIKYTREYYLKNRTKLLENHKRWRERHKLEFSLRNKKWKEENKEHVREINLQSGRRFRIKNKGYYNKYYLSIKQKMFEIIGCRCIKCGLDDFRTLQFDHINGGGGKEIKQFGNSVVMLRYYVKHPEEAKEKLQVLCANCNWIKRYENSNESGGAHNIF